jgi:hypothetical protein
MLAIDLKYIFKLRLKASYLLKFEIDEYLNFEKFLALFIEQPKPNLQGIATVGVQYTYRLFIS